MVCNMFLAFLHKILHIKSSKNTRKIPAKKIIKISLGQVVDSGP
ncbi:hypothetical protein B4168_1600 [Anoxybacillus flavithermus]|nr:hypothetical protein B4168_1600 [Anoxybacillus flavithermus]OAO84255.1 hypothetical protein GT23_3790 [Parageobacillus thermoglucosidasius]